MHQTDLVIELIPLASSTCWGLCYQGQVTGGAAHCTEPQLAVSVCEDVERVQTGRRSSEKPTRSLSEAATKHSTGEAWEFLSIVVIQSFSDNFVIGPW